MIPDQLVELLISSHEDRAERARAKRPCTASSVGREMAARQTAELLRELLRLRAGRDARA